MDKSAANFHGPSAGSAGPTSNDCDGLSSIDPVKTGGMIGQALGGVRRSFVITPKRTLKRWVVPVGLLKNPIRHGSVPPIPTMTRFGIVCPARKLRFDDNGLETPNGYTVRNPCADGSVIVVFIT